MNLPYFTMFYHDLNPLEEVIGLIIFMTVFLGGEVVDCAKSWTVQAAVGGVIPTFYPNEVVSSNGYKML